MQKDVHFYLTYALARKARIRNNDALKIAWSDQYTDDLTISDLHGIQTQSAVLGNWLDKQIQRSVLVPFHFLPGDNSEQPWVVTPDNRKAHILFEKANASLDLFQLGIALHALQDTFSHQGFTGWDEKINACYPWYYIQSGLPDIGHAEMAALPDIASAVWTDPRNGELIFNADRVMDCAIRTFRMLAISNMVPVTYRAAEPGGKGIFDMPEQEQSTLKNIFQIENYDARKKALIDFSDDRVRYSKINKKFKVLFKRQFIAAASKHLAAAIELIKDLPSKNQN